MTPAAPRYIQVVSVLPGRVRLRLSWLHGHPDEATRVAHGLAKLPGLATVEVRTKSGSVLCFCDEPTPADMEAVVAGVVSETRRLTGVEHVVPLGREPPRELAPPLATAAIAREVSAFFRSINADVLRATDGAFDLGTAVTTGFVVAGAVEVAIEGEIVPPPWFNLAWWGIRTFISFEQGQAADATAQSGDAED
jgi:hypothetical protein